MGIQTINIPQEKREMVSDFIGEDIGNEIDFNLLMTVVEKIESLGYLFTIRENSASYYKSLKPSVNFFAKTKIKAVLEAVIQFIQWYNKNKTNEQ